MEPDPDRVRLRVWFAGFATYLLLACVALVLLTLHASRTRPGWPWESGGALPALAAAPAAVKLLAFAIYISLCCTFLPLPTGPVVAALATRDAAVGPNVWITVLLVAVVGGLASTLANLNDYHLFTWMLRSRRIARVRDTRLYQASARWFARSPFGLLVAFNLIPIPVDVVRMLATTYRYPRIPFAAANFIGRLLRYGLIAWITWSAGDKGWMVVVGLLAVTVVLGARRLLRRRRRDDAEAAA